MSHVYLEICSKKKKEKDTLTFVRKQMGIVVAQQAMNNFYITLDILKFTY